MSDSIDDELLAGDEDFEGDYDIQLEDENALLDDNFDISVKTKVAGKSKQTEPTEDVLELEEEVELPDEETEAQGPNETTEDLFQSDTEEEKREKFANERKGVAKTTKTIIPENLEKVASGKVFTSKPRGGIGNRGRGRGGRNNLNGRVKNHFQGNQNNFNSPNLQYPQQQNHYYAPNMQNLAPPPPHNIPCQISDDGLPKRMGEGKKVLINPHFKGNFQAATASMNWENQHPPYQDNGMIRPQWQGPPAPGPYPNQFEPPPYQPQPLPLPQNQVPLNEPPFPQKPPVHQRLGINYNPNQYNHFNQGPYPPNQPPPNQFQNVPPQNYPPNFNQPLPYQNPNPYQNPQQFNPPFQQSYQQEMPPPNVYQQFPPQYPQNGPPPGPHFNHGPPPPHFQGEFQGPPPNQEFPGGPYGPAPHFHPQNFPPPPHQQPFNGPLPQIANRPPPPNQFPPNQHFGNGPRFQKRPNQVGTTSPSKRNFTQGMNSNDTRKKKRLSSGNSNLCEVPTIDSDSEKVTKAPEPEVDPNEDPETRAYRLKIEEQKKMRERILQLKEERRKAAAAAEGIEENPTIPPAELLKKTDILQTAKPLAENITRTIQNPNVVQVKKPKPDQQVLKLNVVQRVVSQKEPESPGLSSFLNNRKVILRDDSLPDTTLVVISNLAAGTSEVKLRKLCQTMGEVQKLQMSSKERQATVEFKNVASAHSFYKKYQRYMLDLSMIQVTLEPVKK